MRVYSAYTCTAIQVSVSLSPELAAQADPADTVFIFARAESGPRMPLAIVRKQVRDLPVTVTLDDSLAMSPAMVISKFDRVSVGARISKSGNAMPASGDLQGIVSPAATRDAAAVELTIDSLVPQHLPVQYAARLALAPVVAARTRARPDASSRAH